MRDLLEKHVPKCYQEEGTLETTLLHALLNQRAFMDELMNLFQKDTPQSLFRNIRRQFFALSYLVSDKFKKGNMPSTHPKQDINIVAYDFFHNTAFEKLFATPMYLHIPWVEKHGIIVAPPGSGKSQLIETLALDWIDDIKEQPTLVIIDSKDDGLFDRISRMEIFHPDRGAHRHRLTIIDPEDLPAMGIFAKGSTILNDLLRGWPGVGSFTTIQEGIVNNLVPLISAIEGTIEDAIEALQHPRHEKFQAALPIVQDSVRSFWEKYQPKDYGQSLPGVIGRLQAIISIPLIGQMFNARENRFDMFKEMDDGRIILIRTSKGLLGIERSNALAKFFISQVFSAATRRSRYKHETYLVVDEAVKLIDEVTEESYETLRSYNVHCIYATVSAHQLGEHWYSTGQLSDVRFAAALEGSEASHVKQFMGRNCTVDFLHEQQKQYRDDGKRSDWIKVGCYVKGVMKDDPVSLKIKTGLLDAQGFMKPVAYRQLRRLNKERLTAKPAGERNEKAEDSRDRGGNSTKPSSSY